MSTSLVGEHRQNLANDLPCGEITLQPQKRGHAESAIDGTSHLAGDADGRATPILPVSQLFIAARGAVASLAAIAVRHPDRFHRLAVTETQEISHRAVNGSEALLNARQTRRVAELSQLLAQLERQRREVF